MKTKPECSKEVGAVWRDWLVGQTITVRAGGATFEARISGRLNRFATLTILPHGGAYEAAWETVQRASDNGTPIIVA